MARGQTGPAQPGKDSWAGPTGGATSSPNYASRVARL
jgi:hypothetical protein